MAVQLEAMGDVGAYVKKVADQLWAYRLCNNGGVPKRNSDCKEERALAMDVAKLRVRCHKSLGPKPKESQLNQEEVAYLTEKLQGPIPVADATSEMGASSADVQGTGRSRLRAVVGPATTGAVGQTNAIQGSGAEHVAPVAVGHAAAPAAPPGPPPEPPRKRLRGKSPAPRSGAPLDRALVIKPEWCEQIFAHGKRWEIRGEPCNRRGRFAIAESGTSTSARGGGHIG